MYLAKFLELLFHIGLQLSWCVITILEGFHCGYILNKPVKKGISSCKTVRW